MEGYNSIDGSSKTVKNLIQEYMKETKDELWNWEKEISDFYSKDENYSKLITGEVGGNLIYKYKAMNWSQGDDGWLTHIGKSCKKNRKRINKK